MNGRLLTIDELTHDQFQVMLKLMETHYLNVHRDTFRADLMSKSHVLLLEVDQRIVGFSSLIVYHTIAPDLDPIQVVFSGDTVVDRDHWGSPVLFRSWMETLAEIGAYGEGIDSYWLLLAAGARTYRMLTAFWKTYYPRFDRDHAQLALLADRLAGERFGNLFDAESGIVRFKDAYAVRPEIMPLEQAEANPHVRYFHRRNPGHALGDELVCLTELSPCNLTRLGARMVAAS